MDKIGQVLLAIVSMILWIGLLGWVTVANGSLPRLWLAQGWTTATQVGHRAQKGLRRQWHPEYIVRVLAAILVVFAVIFFYMGMNADDTDKFAATFAPNLATDCFSLAVTIVVIDQLYRWRDKVDQKRVEKILAAQRKRNIIQQMASRSNDFALEAVRIAAGEGWLKDGSFLLADLVNANLQGASLRGTILRYANLESANLRDADLIGTNLQDANLSDANLQGAFLIGANLQDAKLIRADLQGTILGFTNLQGAGLESANLQGANLIRASLQGANLVNAKYSMETRWPEGFEPEAHGAVRVDTSD